MHLSVFFIIYHFLQVDRLLELKPFCQSVAAINNKFQVSDETWQQIEKLHEPLKVVAETMVKIQAENFTLSDAYGQWITLREDLKSIECTPFVSTLLTSMETRGSPLMTTTLMVTAVFLDPRFHLLLSEREKYQAMLFLKRLADRTLPQEDNMDAQPSNNTTADDDTSTISPLERLLRVKEMEQNQIDERGREETQTIHSKLLVEIAKFQKMKRIDSNSNIHTYWLESRMQLPLLYELATVIMSISPTEVSCERNFSKLKFIMNRLRCSLSDEEIEKINFLSLNAEFFDEL